MALGGRELRAHSKPVRWSAQHGHLGHHKQDKPNGWHQACVCMCLRVSLRIYGQSVSQQKDIHSMWYRGSPLKGTGGLYICCTHVTEKKHSSYIYLLSCHPTIDFFYRSHTVAWFPGWNTNNQSESSPVFPFSMFHCKQIAAQALEAIIVGNRPVLTTTCFCVL